MVSNKSSSHARLCSSQTWWLKKKISAIYIYVYKTWVTTKRNMTHLEAAEMHFLRSVAGYTRLDKIRSEIIQKELEISGIQDVRTKYKQN